MYVQKETKGGVGTAFYMAIKSFLNFDNFQDAIDWIIGEHPRSDTDTNGAIFGALMGAKLGFSGH